jgi:hypothetical protein
MSDTHQCVACNRTKEEVPLLVLVHKDEQFHICPEHLPILIHQPHKLADVLPGVASLDPGSHDHH